LHICLVIKSMTYKTSKWSEEEETALIQAVIQDIKTYDTLTKKSRKAVQEDKKALWNEIKEQCIFLLVFHNIFLFK